MKTFRFIGMALFAILMCVNLSSCSSSDDDPTEEKEEGGVVVSGKKITKIVGTGVFKNVTYTFKYDDKGKLVESIYTEGPDGNIDVVNKKYTWSDNTIKVNWSSGQYHYSQVLTIKNGLVTIENSSDENPFYYKKIFTYNESNKIVKIEDEGDDTTTAIWDGEKLESISNTDGWNTSLIYEKSCKNGYFPFIAEMIGGENEVLFMAHPEIVGMKTTQLPSTMTDSYDYGVYGSGTDITHFNYEFDNEGYISKIAGEVDGSAYAYTITWQ